MPRRKPIARRTPLKAKKGLKRTAIKRGLSAALDAKTELKRRTPLRKVSDKKREADKEFVKNRLIAFERANGLCEVKMVAWGCTRVATDGHHIKRRSQGVDHSVDNILATCHSCHMGIHRSIQFSRQRGWIRSAYEGQYDESSA